MFWMIVTRFFCKTEILRDFPCTLKAGIFSLKQIFSPFIKKRILLFSLHSSGRRQGKINLKAFLEIIESVVSSPFVKAEADSVEYFVLCLKRSVQYKKLNKIIPINRMFF
jgi:hypothetical protein